jgi:hypothetical protein
MTSLAQEESEERWQVERLVPNDPDCRKEIRHGRVGSMKHDAWYSNLTPKEYWQEHVDGWLEEASHHDRIHVIRYEDLQTNLDREMQNMADFFGLESQTFVDVKTRVSMNPVGRTDVVK